MERLICSSSAAFSKPHLSPPYPNVTRLGHLEPRKYGFLIPTTMTYSKRSLIKPFTMRCIRPQICCFSKGNDDPVHFESSIDQSTNGLIPFLQSGEVKTAGSKSEKVFMTRKIITLSSALAMMMTLTLPFISTSPALAAFQAATKAVNSGLLSSAWTGFFAGCLHTLSGPDHLAALAPLSIGRTRLESAAVGALWGCGHDAGQLIFGLLFLILKDRLHIEVFRTWGSRVVGLTLLAIGAMGIKEASEVAVVVPTPCVALETGDSDLSSVKSLMGGNNKKKEIGFATFATGLVHGLQPDALMIVLPALALPSKVAGAAFLGMFLVGTVVAMGGYTVFLGSCSQALIDRVPRITEKLTWASSLVAIGLGLAIFVSEFYGFSLY